MSSKARKARSRLLDLFDGRRQLIVYRAFLDPGVHGWPDHGCVGCSLMADHIGNLAHLNARDTTLVYASRGSQADIARIRQRMGWDHPWYTIVPSRRRAFDVDFGVDEWHGTNAFIRDGDRVYRTYFINSRGDEVFDNTFHFLDMTALGRQEAWEDSPEGYPQTKPYEWWRWHDEYGEHESSREGVIRVSVPTRAALPGSIKTPRTRVTALVTRLDEAALSTAVAACPGWSVRDVVAHLAAVADDWVGDD